MGCKNQLFTEVVILINLGSILDVILKARDTILVLWATTFDFWVPKAGHGSIIDFESISRESKIPRRARGGRD